MRVLHLLQKLFDCLYSPFSFSIALLVSWRAGGVAELIVSGKIFELSAGKLRSIVLDHQVWDPVGSEDRLDSCDCGSVSFVQQLVNFSPSGEVIYHNDISL